MHTQAKPICRAGYMLRQGGEAEESLLMELSAHVRAHALLLGCRVVPPAEQLVPPIHPRTSFITLLQHSGSTLRLVLRRPNPSQIFSLRAWLFFIPPTHLQPGR